ncbi:MAG TPA: D-alanyl-D-alanine carboxypeptidase/D-alanyl-D-alanine-endopeptidase [Candidatus Baltobacteraceae bacterium]|jgi:D-alanyl-D-alanine carboxypeptidase/D-alanyl-D-alanine-endopeptidase (penicillin-binding protein 4)|nr:D-alanyl-D-alanine carboxypeptidase/D-alanyl-D-alanine-endopeptidase [Candidatus Baltobacteraceae bacterium]
MNSPLSAAEHLPFPNSLASRSWTSTEVAVLKQHIDAAIAKAPLLGTHLGILALDTDRGRVLYERNADDAFVPASTLKLLTGIVALEKLGADAHFRTQLVARGTRDGSLLRGMLVLRAGGDPELDTTALQEAATAIVAAGFSGVTQGVSIDASAFRGAPYGAGWAWDDFPNAYSAPIAAIAVNENAVHATLTPGASVGDPATLTLPPGEVEASRLRAFRFGNFVTTGSAESLDTADAWWGDEEVGVSGSLPLGAAPEEIDVAIRDPLRVARRLLGALLTERHVAGCTVEADAPIFTHSSDDAETTLWTHESSSLGTMLADMWLPSDNFIAEMWLRDVAHVASAESATVEDGIAIERDFLRSLGVDPATFTIVDGSGLSRQDLLTPRDLAVLLGHAWASPQRSVVLDALPIAGLRGTLAHKFTDSPLTGRLFAKTGSMRNVANLAGYVATYAHGPVTVVIMADDALIDDDSLARLQMGILSALLEG